MSSNSWTEKLYDFIFAPSQNEDLLAYPNLPLCGPLSTVLIVNLAYLLFVKKIGPWLMRNREPFNIKKIIMIHNLIQIILSGIVFICGINLVFFNDTHQVGCVLKLPPYHPIKKNEVTIVYIGYLTKYMDLLDTIFFVLRKSYRQISFLHVYHHICMTVVPYFYFRSYGIGGHFMFNGVINAFVHVIMYSYYFVTAAKPELKKSIWWKRHITELQIIQFIIVCIHQSWPLFVRKDCTFSKYWLIGSISNTIVFLILFLNFYREAYLKKTTANGNTKTKAVKNL